MTNYMRGARPKGSPKPTKGLYKKRGSNKNKTTNVRGGTTGKGTVFKSTKDVIAEKKKKPNILEKMEADKIRKQNLKRQAKKEKGLSLEEQHIIRKEMLYPQRNLTKEQFEKFWMNKILRENKKNIKKKSSGGQALVQSLYDKG